MLDVRAGLREMMTCALVRDLGRDSLGTTELVLAEVLNNVVEHAYSAFPGVIEVEVQRAPDRLNFHISDMGLPMPGAEPPPGRLPDLTSFEDLPEGGFGWFLIRRLAQDLRYSRADGGNRLSFHVSVDNAG